MDNPEKLATSGTHDEEYTLCCQFFWIVHVQYSLTCILRHVCLMLPVSLDCPCSVFFDVYWQSRETGNIRHTGRRIHVREYRKWTIQSNWQHKAHRTKNTRQRISNMDNPEKLPTPVCLMLVVSLDCPCLVFSNVYSSSYMPYVGSFSGLSMFGIL
jgi:hypothetical protein